ncbi:MAG: hypothetical protein OZ913_06310 [Ignavibacteriaceae bacterium]|jgi:hypothetical protein|nr:MAG: hypothetical protein EDM69_08605 [Chlorobiota bacterium]KXK01851.1 MAG: hypothetical protein UZ04_CHB001002131 [Chlorobi bacterium OLB4]MBV6399363.1 hypothetical protein [Ignavibacteria bacterium]MCC6886808.1 hypothetical protein [Ignavibacteriales bacterium]MCE7953745.1 hypothetical protein [Chlorobi bacterium CHB7]MDL1887679.1 hypothetical protein [Ignavibacteria bacterium CHB1]MEB2329900.1 hypothetical protein [Ignavibacteriaceae bacterium]OQY77487.1 MAG: hypothetical protein B6D4
MSLTGFIEHWIDRAILFEAPFQIIYITIVTFATILIRHILMVFMFNGAFVFIPYGFYFLFFFLWIYRISFAGLVKSELHSVKLKDCLLVFTLTLSSLALLLYFFRVEQISFGIVIVGISGFSMFSIFLLLFLKLLAIQSSVIYKYFICIFIASVFVYLTGILTSSV